MCLILRIIILFLCVGKIWNSDGHLSKTYVGCFNGYPVGRISDHSLFPFFPTNCFELCAGRGNPFAAIMSSSSICYCGDRISSNPSRVNDTQCKPCVQERSVTCGEKGTSSLYHLTSAKLSEEVNIKVLIGRLSQVALLDPLISSEVILAPTEDSELSAMAVDYHWTRREVYATWDNRIHRFPLDVNGTTTEVVGVVNSCVQSVFALDWVHDRLFWPDCRLNGIMMSDLDGKNSDRLLRLPVHYGWINDIVVDPYRGMLFWILSDDLWSSELDGRNSRQMVINLPTTSVLNLALDMAERILYFYGEVANTMAVFHVQYDGMDLRQVFTWPAEQPVHGFGVFRSRLYFFTNLQSNNRTALFKTSFGDNVTQATELQVLKESINESLSSPLHSMKLIHYELQSPIRVDECTWNNCSHHCVVLDSAARCLCPRKYDLDANGKTCNKKPEENKRLVYQVLAGLGCIVFVLLSAGVLMGIVDKAWSHIHPTVVRVTRAREIPARSSPIFRQTRDSQDSDNSI